MEHQESGHPKTFTSRKLVQSACPNALDLWTGTPSPDFAVPIPAPETPSPAPKRTPTLRWDWLTSQVQVSLAGPGVAGLALNQHGPQLSHLATSPLFSRRPSSLHPSLSHLPLPPAKRTRARSASSPPLSFLNASLRYPFFSLPVFHPPKSGEAPTSRAARANSPIHILVLGLRLRQSLRASLPEDHRLDCPPLPPVIRSPVSGTPSRPS